MKEAGTTYVQGKKYRWKVPVVEVAHATKLAGRFNLSRPIIDILLSRSHVSEEAIERFLFMSKEQDVAHPSRLKDAQKAVDRLLVAIEKKEKILICGDYDVDGITSSSLMLMCLLPLGADVNFFLPNRVRDGYGLSVKTVERAGKNNYKVLITVDNGITAFEPALEALRQGIDLIITDHHRPHDHVPKAFALINPHQSVCEYPYKHFAGVGVSFKLMALLYEHLGLELPSQVYELLLLGTVADVVPLTGENRFWVRHGLQQIKKLESGAFGVLKKNGRVTKPVISSTDIGFFIAPQINALGRLDDPRDGVKFLMSTEMNEVERIGQVLIRLNEARKGIEKNIISDIDAQLKDYDMVAERVVVAASKNWAPGVIGLAASRIVGAHHRPTFLFHINNDGIAKGSCRSITAFNVFDALCELKDMLITFGGHAAAAGLALKAERIPEFKERMTQLVNQRVTEDQLSPSLRLDADLTLRDIGPKLVYDLSYLEPFGCENPVPVFYLKNVSFIGQPQLLKDAHVKATVFADGITKPIIFFNRPELFSLIQEALHGSCDIAVHVTENHWNNEVRVELQGIDIVVNS